MHNKLLLVTRKSLNLQSVSNHLPPSPPLGSLRHHHFLRFFVVVVVVVVLVEVLLVDGAVGAAEFAVATDRIM